MTTSSPAAATPPDDDEALRRWRTAVTAVLRRSGRLAADEEHPAPEELLAALDADGLRHPPLGTARTLEESGAPDPGLPGAPPFVRGASPVLGSRPGAEASSSRASTAPVPTAPVPTAPVPTAQGSTGVGRDPERPAGWDVRQRVSGEDAGAVREAALAELEGGATSLWLDVGGPGGVRLADLPRALDGVLLDLAPVVLRTAARADPVAAARALLALAPSGPAPHPLALGVGADPLARSARTGEPAADGEGGRSVVLELAGLALEHPLAPGALAVDALPASAAGGTPAQVLAWGVGAALQHLRWLLGAGVDPARAARLLELRLPATDDQWATTASLRAARAVWARAAELLGVPADARGLRLHAVTSRAMLGVRDPHVDVLRATVAALAAGVGGAEAVTVLPHDAAVGASTASSRRLARGTSSILLAESSVGRVVDPAGGAPALEQRTWALAGRAWALLQDLERRGGPLGVLADGSFAAALARSWEERRRAVATRSAPLTGTTTVVETGARPLERAPDPAAAAEGAGGWPEHRWSQDVDALRQRTDALRGDGPEPEVGLVRLDGGSAGPAAAWAVGLLGVAGLLARDAPAQAPGEAPAVVLLVGGDDDSRAGAAAALRARGARWVLLARGDDPGAGDGRAPGAAGARPGLPEGVDDAVAEGEDVLVVLHRVLDALGAVPAPDAPPGLSSADGARTRGSAAAGGAGPAGPELLDAPLVPAGAAAPGPSSAAGSSAAGSSAAGSSGGGDPGDGPGGDGAPAPAAVWRTPEGIAVPALATAADLAALPAADRAAAAGYPGQAPYLRGPYPTMYAAQPWTVRQYAGFSTAAESNAFYRRALAAGQRGLSVAFDLATHRGYDSDHPRVAGDVGMAGVAVDSLLDARELFDGIPLGEMSVSMTMNGAVLPVLALYVAAAEEQGVPRARLSGTIQNDILKEFMVRNTYIYPPGPSMAVVSDVFAHTSARMPRFNSISISGYHMQEAGATADLELAYTLADGVEYLRAGVAAGLPVDAFAPRLSFFWAVGTSFLTEVAKLRAARVLWARLVQPFSPQDPRSSMLRAHCQTSGWSLTASDVQLNVVRTCVEAMAATQGGTQSLHTNALDEALALPSDAAARTARVTQLLLQQETGTTSVVDPWGGSHSLERLTSDLAARARAHLDEVEAAGGMARAIEEGIPKRRIEEAAARTQARIDARRQQVVGVNVFTVPRAEQDVVEVRRVEGAGVRAQQVAKLERLRRERDAGAVADALRRLTAAARAVADGARRGGPDAEDGNLLALSVEAARAHATVGEMSAALEEVFGRHTGAVSTITGVYRQEAASEQDAGADAVAAVALDVAAFEEEEGRRPRILVAKMGQDGHDRGQKVIATAFADLGFDVDVGPLFSTPEEVARQAVEADVHVVGVSSLAAGHLVLVPQLREALAAEGREDVVVVVGGVVPPDDVPLLLEMGAAAVFGPGTVVATAARDLLAELRARR
nr:methylmalonyl-CoA mutase [uncultured Pseudokineococcus sp.]